MLEQDTLGDEARRREKLDREKARPSPLWPKAVALLKEEITEADKKLLREAIEKDPKGWIGPHHFFWGMAIRNLLRQKGFGEKEFGIDNMDNVYVPLIEEAVKGESS